MVIAEIFANIDSAGFASPVVEVLEEIAMNKREFDEITGMLCSGSM